MAGKSILPLRARGTTEALVGELSAKVNALETESKKSVPNVVTVINQPYYMTHHIDGIWGKFINVVDGKLVGGMIAAVQSQPISQITINIIRGKLTKTILLNVTQSPIEIEFPKDITVSNGDLILVESKSDAISTISLTLIIEK